MTECHGNLDFKDGESAPRCKPRSRDEIQLGAGSEADNHIVSVKPRGSGAEFTLIHVQTRSSTGHAVLMKRWVTVCALLLVPAVAGLHATQRAGRHAPPRPSRVTGAT